MNSLLCFKRQNNENTESPVVICAAGDGEGEGLEVILHPQEWTKQITKATTTKTGYDQRSINLKNIIILLFY